MAFNPDASQLSEEQIIQQVFNSDDNSLRVDATVEAIVSVGDVVIQDPITGNKMKVNADGSINVDTILSAATDSVQSNTFDGVGNPISSSDGALDVNVVSTVGSGTPISIYNEVTGIAISASTVILTYTVPGGQSLALQNIIVSSDCISTIELEFNSTVNAKGRLCYTNYNLSFGYNNFSLVTGTVITVNATNDSLNNVASFNATIQGTLT